MILEIIGFFIEMTILILIYIRLNNVIKIEQIEDKLKKCDEMFDRMQIDIYDIEQRLNTIAKVVYREKCR